MPRSAPRCALTRRTTTVLCVAICNLVSLVDNVVAAAQTSQTPADPAEPIEEIVVLANRNLLGQSLGQGGFGYQLRPATQTGLQRSVADALVHVPGISLNGQGGLFQSYSLRGLSRWRIRTEVNGIPLLIDRPAGTSASFIPNELIEQITVTQGPSSTLYGSEAMGGVIALDTQSTHPSFLGLRWQNNGQSLSLTAKGKLNAHVSAAMNVRHANAAEDPQGQRLNTGYEQAALSLSGHYQWRSLSLDANWLPVRGRDIGKSNRNVPEAGEASYPYDDHSLTNLKINWDDQWLAQIYHHRQDWASESRTVDTRRRLTQYEADTVGALIYAAMPVTTGSGRMGVEWLARRNVTIRSQDIAPGPSVESTSTPVNGDQDSVGVFIDHTWRRQTVDVEMGARYDHIEQQGNGSTARDAALSGNISLSWTPDDIWRMTAKLGTGFRFPTLTERLFNGVTPRGETVGNPELKPEYSDMLELQAHYNNGDLSVTFSTYYNWLDNYIERINVGPNKRSYRNSDRAFIWGYEASLGWQILPTVSHQLQYHKQRGENDRGNQLADLNPPTFRYAVIWDTPYAQLQADLVYRPARESSGPGEVPIDSSVWLDSQVNFPLSSTLGLSLFINNVFDELYTGSADEEAAFQPGRTLGIGIDWQP